MTVKAVMPVRFNLVVPLAHEATAMRVTDTARQCARLVQRSFPAERSAGRR